MGLCAWRLARAPTFIPSAVDIASCGSSGVEALCFPVAVDIALCVSSARFTGRVGVAVDVASVRFLGVGGVVSGVSDLPSRAALFFLAV